MKKLLLIPTLLLSFACIKLSAGINDDINKMNKDIEIISKDINDLKIKLEKASFFEKQPILMQITTREMTQNALLQQKQQLEQQKAALKK